MKMVRTIAGVLVSGCLAAASLADRIELRSVVAVQAGEAITLADVAELDGADADGLGGVVLIDRAGSGPRAIEISIEQVRETLSERGVSVGRLALNGSVCVVRIRPPTSGAAQDEPEAQDAPAPASSVGSLPSGGEAPAPVAASGAETVGAWIESSIATLLEVERSDLRVEFAEGDRAFLEGATWGRRVVVEAAGRPGGGLIAARMALVVRIYSGDALAEERRLRVGALVRASVCETVREIPRGAIVSEADVRLVERWIPPGGDPAPGSLESVVGQASRTMLREGVRIRSSDLQQPIVVRRNQRVSVLAIRGGIELQAEAIAMQDGSRGEVIECRLGRDSSPFLATVIGAGRVQLSDRTNSNGSDG